MNRNLEYHVGQEGFFICQGGGEPEPTGTIGFGMQEPGPDSTKKKFSPGLRETWLAPKARVLTKIFECKSGSRNPFRNKSPKSSKG